MLGMYTLVLKRCDKFDHNLFVAYISSRSHGDNIRDGWFCTQCPECKCSMIHSQVICKRHFAEVSRAYLLRVLPKYPYFWFARLAFRLAQEWGGAIQHTIARVAMLPPSTQPFLPPLVQSMWSPLVSRNIPTLSFCISPSPHSLDHHIMFSIVVCIWSKPLKLCYDLWKQGGEQIRSQEFACQNILWMKWITVCYVKFTLWIAILIKSKMSRVCSDIAFISQGWA